METTKIVENIKASVLRLAVIIALSPIDIANQPTTFEIVCARVLVGCFTAIIILLYWPGSQPLQQQQTFIDELTPMLERVKFDVAFMHRIVSRYFV